MPGEPRMWPFIPSPSVQGFVTDAPSMHTVYKHRFCVTDERELPLPLSCSQNHRFVCYAGIIYLCIMCNIIIIVRFYVSYGVGHGLWLRELKLSRWFAKNSTTKDFMKRTRVWRRESFGASRKHVMSNKAAKMGKQSSLKLRTPHFVG